MRSTFTSLTFIFLSLLFTFVLHAATTAAAPLPFPHANPQDADPWPSGFDSYPTSDTASYNNDNMVPANGATGMGDGYGPGPSSDTGQSDEGGLSCVWSDANGCEQ